MERTGIKKLDLLFGSDSDILWNHLEEENVVESEKDNRNEGYVTFDESEASNFKDIAEETFQKRYYYSMKAINRRAEIKREALLDADHLAEFIPKYKLSELIRVATEVNTNTINSMLEAINSRVTTFLWKHIPKRLRGTYNVTKNEFPHFAPRSPGFIYRFEHGGEIYSLWIEPDIPQVIPQFTEQEFIDSDDKFKNILRKSILKYYGVLAFRSKKELKLASKLYNVITVYDLVNKDPDLYELYISRNIHNITRREAKQNLKTRFR